MKQFRVAFILLFFVQVSYAQLTGITDSTTTLLTGTYAKDGKIYLKQGYQFKISPDKKVATVMAMSNNGITGSFSCVCGTLVGVLTGKCLVSVDGSTGTLSCGGSACCSLAISTGGSLFPETPAPNKNNNPLVKWKVLVLPTKAN